MAVWREFLRDPRAIGAVAASGPALSRHMVSAACERGATRPGVVEVGAGTGAFTEEIVARLAPSWFVALEPNLRLAATLRQRCPSIEVVTERVEALREVLAERGHTQIDVVVSGLPFAAWPEPQQRRALHAIASALGPRGRLVTFGYLHSALLPAGVRFRRVLGDYFGHVRVTGVAWWNLPPARVICATEPRLPQ